MVQITRRAALAGTAAALAAPALVRAQDGAPIRIGVLTDMSSWGRDNGGAGSVYAANQAAREMKDKLGRPVEIIVGDHKMTPDLGVQIVRGWFDTGAVDAIADVPHSAIALAVSGLAAEKDRIALFSGPGSSDITGSRCNARTVQFTYDTYATTKVATTALMAEGAKSFYFIVVDYAFGRSLQQDATAAIQKAGGKALGAVTHPAGTTDFSSLLLQAKSSGADVIALCNSGQDCTNALKQAAEFGITRGGTRMTGLGMFLTDVHGAGLAIAQNTVFATSSYWNMNPEAAAWSKAYFAQVGMMPTMLHAGTYGVVLHYLKAIAAAGGKDSATVMAKMRELPIDNAFVKDARLRADGRVVRDMYLARVKTPAESKGPWDYVELVRTVKAEDAVRPVSESACPLLKKA